MPKTPAKITATLDHGVMTDLKVTSSELSWLSEAEGYYSGTQWLHYDRANKTYSFDSIQDQTLGESYPPVPDLNNRFRNLMLTSAKNRDFQLTICVEGTDLSGKPCKKNLSLEELQKIISTSDHLIASQKLMEQAVKNSLPAIDNTRAPIFMKSGYVRQ